MVNSISLWIRRLINSLLINVLVICLLWPLLCICLLLSLLWITLALLSIIAIKRRRLACREIHDPVYDLCPYWHTWHYLFKHLSKLLRTSENPKSNITIYTILATLLSFLIVINIYRNIISPCPCFILRLGIYLCH